MKKIVVAAITTATLGGVFGIAPYYLGNKAQQSLQTQHSALADTFYIDVVSHEYQRGWFSSTETTVMRMHPTVLAKLNPYLPDNIKALFSQPITMVNHVKHNVFANGVLPVRAVVETQFQYDPEVEKTLTRFFGAQTPVSMRNVIQLNGSGSLKIRVAPFDYEELSGIKIHWQGMDTVVDYADSYAHQKGHFVIPGLKLQLADKGSLKAENIELAFESKNGANGIALGSSDTKIGQFELGWNDEIAYDIRLNDLVNMVTNLQVGAFINPTGSIAPNHISVQNLHYHTQTDANEGDFINSEGQFSFEKLQYDQAVYGPLNVNIAAEHIDGKAIAALKQRWAQIATMPRSPESEDEIQNLALEAVRNEGAGLFTNNPTFKIKTFHFTTPNGDIDANGELRFNQLTASDLHDFGAMVQKTYADIHLSVSQSLLENFAISRMRGFFTVEDPTNANEEQELDETFRILFQTTINNMIQSGYLTINNGAIQTRVVLDNNRIELNGTPIETQSDEDLLSKLEAQTNPETASSVAH